MSKGTRVHVGRVTAAAGFVVTVTLEVPADLPIPADEVQRRAEDLAAMALGTFGLSPRVAEAFVKGSLGLILDTYEIDV